jgi:hypothetical protein
MISRGLRVSTRIKTIHLNYNVVVFDDDGDDDALSRHYCKQSQVCKRYVIST